MKNWMKLGLVAVLALPLAAHHKFSSEYDANKPVTLSGTIRTVNWSDPHVHFTMDVKNESGKTEVWTLETAKPSYLQSHNAPKSVFKKGAQVTVNAYAASKGGNMASARVLTTSDGKEIQVADPSEDGGPAK
jgi:hypothetical protein